MIFNSAFLPYWILIAIGFSFFILIIVLGGGDDDADLEVETDLDMGSDGDLEVEADGEVETNGNPGLSLLSWLGLGKAPLMVLLAFDFSLWGMVGLLLSSLTTTHLGDPPTGLMANGIMVGSFGLAVVVGGWVARPIGLVLASFGEDTSGERLLGREGTVSSALIPKLDTGKIGQVDVMDAAGNLSTVSAILPNWATTPARQGDTVVVIDSHGGDGYVVIVKDSLDQDRWLQSDRSLKLNSGG